MNLLEIWIDEIISEEELENEMVRVKATYVCWGAKETKERIYPKKILGTDKKARLLFRVVVSQKY